jgi:hypothetical protein
MKTNRVIISDMRESTLYPTIGIFSNLLAVMTSGIS